MTSPSPFANDRRIRTPAQLNLRLNEIAQEIADIFLPRIVYVGNNEARCQELQSLLPGITRLWPIPRRQMLADSSADLVVIDLDDRQLDYDDILEFSDRTANVSTIICTHKLIDPLNPERTQPLLLLPQISIDSLTCHIENSLKLAFASLSFYGWVPLISTDPGYVSTLIDASNAVFNGESIVVSVDDLNHADSIRRWLCNTIDFPKVTVTGDCEFIDDADKLAAGTTVKSDTTVFVYQVSSDQSAVETLLDRDDLQVIVLRARHQFEADGGGAGCQTRKKPSKDFLSFSLPDFHQRPTTDAETIAYFLSLRETLNGPPRYLNDDQIQKASKARTLTQFCRQVEETLSDSKADQWMPPLPEDPFWPELSLSTVSTGLESMVIDQMLEACHVKNLARYIHTKPKTIYARRQNVYPESRRFLEQKTG